MLFHLPEFVLFQIHLGHGDRRPLAFAFNDFIQIVRTLVNSSGSLNIARLTDARVYLRPLLSLATRASVPG